MRRAMSGLLGMMLASAAAAQTWPYPDDIPKPKPVSVGLAGAAEPDVTRYLLAQGATQARLSPDGRQVVYVSTVTGKPQLWVADASGGAPQQLTFGLGVDGGEWTPDGARIIYGADRGGDERYGFYTVTPDGAREAELVPQSDAFTVYGDVADRGRALAYATTARDKSSFDTWLAPLDGGKPRQVFRGRMGLYPALAQPGGTLIAMTESRGEDGQDLSLIDTATGRERVLRKASESAMNVPVAWTPDGKGLYIVTNEGREFGALVLLDVASGSAKIVEAPEHDVVGADLSADGRYLAWLTDESGFHTIHVRDLSNGKLLRTPALPKGTASIRFARDMPVLVAGVTGPQTPGEIWTWNVRTGAASRSVAANMAGLDAASLVLPEPVAFTARDGVRLSGLLYSPRKRAGRAPVFLRLHGGPSSHARADWKPDVQYLVARGIAVLDFNYRGSTGAGKSHARLNDKRLRPDEIGDLVDAVNWIKRQAQLDGARVAVGGPSYGGYLTNAVVGKHPGLFVAAVSEVGVADWPRNLRNASPQLKASDRLEYGDIDDPGDAAFFASISPMNDAAKVRTPMIVQTGANDPRNGADELDVYVTAIRKGGGTVRYMRYENEGHRMTDLANIIDFQRAKAAFLEERFRR